MAVLKNEFSWSFSRHKLCCECRRAYYYYYYASWEGWKKDSSELAQKTYRLKKMQNLDMWAGSLVHTLLQEILKNRSEKNVITYEQAITQAHTAMAVQWRQSQEQRWQESPKTYLNLFEHYYHKKVSQELIDRKVKKKVYESIKNFYDSGFLEYLDSLGQEQFLRIEEIDSFPFEKTKMYVVPDFALRDGSVKLYDWKTGRPNPDDTRQLSCYALYAHTKWQVPLEKVKVFPVYLALGIPGFDPWQEKIDTVELITFLRQSIRQMHALLLTGPGENKIDYAKCPRTENTRRCETCVFQEVCV
ncbi:MAG: PD-(D/E)XK nuclease family protein [Candidatus Omnitrophica bacterium]|nr:PD-(D/E)XK nuclease family protein [Candidatus Omnitrophota bacterium]